MKWEEIKKSIVDDLKSRGLKDPGIRMRALEKIEALMRQYFPAYIDNSEELKHVEKEAFKYMLAEKKGKGLNSAEKSIVNEIYDRLFPPQQSPAPFDSCRMCVCPYCNENSIITAELYDYETLICPTCESSFINPYLASIYQFCESSSIEEIINTIDDELIETGEEYLLIGQTNMLLLSANIFSMSEISNKVLRNLLEHNKIPHAYQTDTAPNEWIIPLSEEGKVRKKFKRKIVPAKTTARTYQMKQNPNEQNPNENTNTTKGITLNKRQRNGLIVLAVVIGFIIYSTISDNDSSSDSLTYYITKDTYAATSKKSFDDWGRYAADKDQQAILNMSMQGKLDILSQGTEVYLVSSGLTYCKIRRKGSTQELWVVMGAIKQK